MEDKVPTKEEWIEKAYYILLMVKVQTVCKYIGQMQAHFTESGPNLKPTKTQVYSRIRLWML